MAQCIVIADDLTGANAAGVLLVKRGFRTLSLLDSDALVPDLGTADCIVFPTETRALDPGTAYDRVFAAAQALAAPEVRLYSKRIDTTLRGNLGSESDAMLDALGDGRVALVVPCFPSSKRILVGGCLLVDGVPLHKTAAAVDPKTPVRTPFAAELFRVQSKYPVSSVLMADVLQGAAEPDHLVRKIRDAVKAGARTLIFDAAAEDDISAIADAALASQVPFVAVDPGVFTAALAAKMLVSVMPAAQKTPDIAKTSKAAAVRQKILVAVGSVNAVARAQVETLLSGDTVHNVWLNTAAFLESEASREAEIERAVTATVAASKTFDLCSIVGQGIFPEKRVPFEPFLEKYRCTLEDLSMRINEALAEILWRIITREPAFRNVYTCGGDNTLAVCKRLGSPALRLLAEVLPLAAYGEVLGGGFRGLKMISKGGMVGDADAILRCVEYFRSHKEII